MLSVLRMAELCAATPVSVPADVRAVPLRTGADEQTPSKHDDRYAAALLAVGFVHVNTVLLRRIHALIVIEHGTRGAHLAGVTAHPDGWWTIQAVGIRILLSPPQAPRANAAC
jgi:hypothetical protein